MGLSDSISAKFSSMFDSIKDQGWYQQASASFQQLSPEQQSYVRWGSMGAGVLLLFFLIYSAADAANRVKSDYFQKQELLTLINQAGDEIRRLKGQNATLAMTGEQSWKQVLTNVVTSQGLAPEAVEITKESAGASQSMIQETLIEADLKGVFIRPLTLILYQIEHNSPPMKLKGLHVQPGAEGLLNAKLVLSGFMPKPEKK